METPDTCVTSNPPHERLFSPPATPRSPPETRQRRSRRSPPFPSERLREDTWQRPPSSTRRGPSFRPRQLCYAKVPRRKEGGGSNKDVTHSALQERTRVIGKSSRRGPPSKEQPRKPHISSHPPAAHLEAIRLNQVAGAQDAVQAGQEPHRTRAEGPVLLRKRRGFQASVRRAVVGQRLHRFAEGTRTEEKAEVKS